LLAPGTVPGRVTVYTEAAIKKLDDEKLFTENPIKTAKKEVKKENKEVKKKKVKSETKVKEKKDTNKKEEKKGN
jgi:hypothetical protein